MFGFEHEVYDSPEASARPAAPRSALARWNRLGCSPLPAPPQGLNTRAARRRTPNPTPPSPPQVKRKLPRFPFLKDFSNFTGDDFWPDDPYAAMQYQSAARRFVIRDRSYALRAGIMMAGEGDAVVIAGKGHEDFIEVGGERVWHSDQAECRHLLRLLPKKPATLETYNLPWRCKGWPTDMGDFMNG